MMIYMNKQARKEDFDENFHEIETMDNFFSIPTCLVDVP
jgi:hypothetical protein